MGLVHEVVAEHGRMGGTCFCNRFPEARLDLPAFRFGEFAESGWHGIEVVTSQAGKIQREAALLPQIEGTRGWFSTKP